MNEEGWISLDDRRPEDGQKIIGKSHMGEWKETFDKDEPLGAMTHWKPQERNNHENK